MKILIAADMEGITGVVHWNHVDPNHSEYTRFRRLMTGDVNAAIRGAFEGGADEVVVTDGHAGGRNILIEELDTRARLNAGTPSPLSMVQGVQEGVQGVMFLGYHACIGSQNANLDHTWSDERVVNLSINGRSFGESGLNGAVCGHYGAPVILISGDQTVCAEAADFFGPLEQAVVKTASGRFSAECLPPAVSWPKIQDAARQAVSRLKAGQAPQPLRLPLPVSMVVDLVQTEMADRASQLPGSRRTGGRRIEYTAPDMPTLYHAFLTLLALARS